MYTHMPTLQYSKNVNTCTHITKAVAAFDGYFMVWQAHKGGVGGGEGEGEKRNSQSLSFFPFLPQYNPLPHSIPATQSSRTVRLAVNASVLKLV